MQNYLVTSTITALPWIHLLLKFFFVNVPNIAAHGLHMTSPDGISSPVLKIIIAVKFGYLPQI